MQQTIQELVNWHYFELEYSEKGYLKQCIVMRVYNTLKKVNKGLKLNEVWKEVVRYYHNMNTPKQTCNEKFVFNPYEGSIPGVTYWGD